MNRHTSIAAARRFQSGGMAPKLQTSAPMTQHPADISRVAAARAQRSANLPRPHARSLMNVFRCSRARWRRLARAITSGSRFPVSSTLPVTIHVDVHGAIPLPPSDDSEESTARLFHSWYGYARGCPVRKRLTHFRNCKLSEAINSEFRVRPARISVPSARSEFVNF